jgi:hypothetical protein
MKSMLEGLDLSDPSYKTREMEDLYRHVENLRTALVAALAVIDVYPDAVKRYEALNVLETALEPFKVATTAETELNDGKL